MQTGRLTISRGHERSFHGSVLAKGSAAGREFPGDSFAAPDPDLHRLDARLTALERLLRLRQQGGLEEAEYRREKARILDTPSDELLLDQSCRLEDREPYVLPGPSLPGPSLLGRLFRWKLVPLGLAAGLIFFFAVRPVETGRFFVEVSRIVG